MNFNGTSAQTITGPNVNNATMAFNVLKVNNAAGVTYSEANATVTMTINSALTIGDLTASSIFSDGGHQILLTATPSLNVTSGTLQLGSGTAATTLPTFSAYNFSAGTTVEYASGQPQTVSASPGYKTLKLSGASVKTAGGTLTIAEDLNIQGGTLSLGTNTANRTTSGGTLTLASGATLDIGGTNGFPTNYATHILGPANTVNYSGTNQSVSGETYGTLNLSGAGTKTAAGPVTINGTLSVATSTTLDPSGNLFTGSGANTMSLSGTLIVDASTFAGSYISFETRTINAGSTVLY